MYFNGGHLLFCLPCYALTIVHRIRKARLVHPESHMFPAKRVMLGVTTIRASVVVFTLAMSLFEWMQDGYRVPKAMGRCTLEALCGGGCN